MNPPPQEAQIKLPPDSIKAALNKAAGVSGRKDEFQVWIKLREHNYWMGTEIGMLRGYGFQGQVTAGDSSDSKCKMGAGYNKLRRENKVAVQSGTRGRGLQLKSDWVGSVFASASWHAEKGAIAVFVWQPVIVEGSQLVDWWRWKDNVGGGTWHGYFGSNLRDITRENCSKDRNPLGQSECALRRTSEWGSRHFGE